MHILLLLAVLFPLVGSVLAVWARTVATAGLMVPFHGDHSLIRIVFVICLVESTDIEMPRAQKK